MFYRLEVDAARWTMKLMFERISKESELSERDLETLYRICKSAIAATEALQTHLNAYSIVHNIRVGTHDEGMQFGREFREHYEKIQSEMR